MLDALRTWVGRFIVRKSSWIEWFEESGMEQAFTYSESFAEQTKAGAENRIVLLQRPEKNWVGIPHDDIT